MKKITLILAALLVVVLSVGALAEAAFVIPTIVAAQSEDDFCDSWKLSGASVSGTYLTAEEVGVRASLFIWPGSINLLMDGTTYTSTWTLTEDGKLLATDPDGLISYYYLMSDGTIATDVDTTLEDGTSVIIEMYFSRMPDA